MQRYAAFLVSLGLSADFNERRQALTRASEHGLDVVRVATTAAERTITEAFAVRVFILILSWHCMLMEDFIPLDAAAAEGLIAVYYQASAASQ